MSVLIPKKMIKYRLIVVGVCELIQALLSCGEKFKFTRQFRTPNDTSVNVSCS